MKGKMLHSAFLFLLLLSLLYLGRPSSLRRRNDDESISLDELEIDRFAEEFSTLYTNHDDIATTGSTGGSAEEGVQVGVDVFDTDDIGTGPTGTENPATPKFIASISIVFDSTYDENKSYSDLFDLIKKNVPGVDGSFHVSSGSVIVSFQVIHEFDSTLPQSYLSNYSDFPGGTGSAKKSVVGWVEENLKDVLPTLQKQYGTFAVYCEKLDQFSPKVQVKKLDKFEDSKQAQELVDVLKKNENGKQVASVRSSLFLDSYRQEDCKELEPKVKKLITKLLSTIPSVSKNSDPDNVYIRDCRGHSLEGESSHVEVAFEVYFKTAQQGMAVLNQLRKNAIVGDHGITPNQIMKRLDSYLEYDRSDKKLETVSSHLITSSDFKTDSMWQFFYAPHIEKDSRGDSSSKCRCSEGDVVIARRPTLSCKDKSDCIEPWLAGTIKERRVVEKKLQFSIHFVSDGLIELVDVENVRFCPGRSPGWGHIGSTSYGKAPTGCGPSTTCSGGRRCGCGEGDFVVARRHVRALKHSSGRSKGSGSSTENQIDQIPSPLLRENQKFRFRSIQNVLLPVEMVNKPKPCKSHKNCPNGQYCDESEHCSADDCCKWRDPYGGCGGDECPGCPKKCGELEADDKKTLVEKSETLPSKPKRKPIGRTHRTCPETNRDNCCRCKSTSYPHQWFDGKCCSHCTAMCHNDRSISEEGDDCCDDDDPWFAAKIVSERKDGGYVVEYSQQLAPESGYKDQWTSKTALVKASRVRYCSGRDDGWGGEAGLQGNDLPPPGCTPDLACDRFDVKFANEMKEKPVEEWIANEPSSGEWVAIVEAKFEGQYDENNEYLNVSKWIENVIKYTPYTRMESGLKSILWYPGSLRGVFHVLHKVFKGEADPTSAYLESLLENAARQLIFEGNTPPLNFKFQGIRVKYVRPRHPAPTSRDDQISLQETSRAADGEATGSGATDGEATGSGATGGIGSSGTGPVGELDPFDLDLDAKEEKKPEKEKDMLEAAVEEATMVRNTAQKNLKAAYRAKLAFDDAVTKAFDRDRREKLSELATRADELLAEETEALRLANETLRRAKHADELRDSNPVAATKSVAEAAGLAADAADAEVDALKNRKEESEESIDAAKGNPELLQALQEIRDKTNEALTKAEVAAKEAKEEAKKAELVVNDSSAFDAAEDVLHESKSAHKVQLVKYQKLKAATLATERAANAAVDPEMKVQAEAIAREQGMALRAIAETVMNAEDAIEAAEKAVVLSKDQSASNLEKTSAIAKAAVSSLKAAQVAVDGSEKELSILSKSLKMETDAESRMRIRTMLEQAKRQLKDAEKARDAAKKEVEEAEAAEKAAKESREAHSAALAARNKLARIERRTNFLHGEIDKAMKKMTGLDPDEVIELHNSMESLQKELKEKKEELVDVHSQLDQAVKHEKKSNREQKAALEEMHKLVVTLAKTSETVAEAIESDQGAESGANVNAAADAVADSKDEIKKLETLLEGETDVKVKAHLLEMLKEEQNKQRELTKTEDALHKTSDDVRVAEANMNELEEKLSQSKSPAAKMALQTALDDAKKSFKEAIAKKEEAFVKVKDALGPKVSEEKLTIHESQLEAKLREAKESNNRVATAKMNKLIKQTKAVHEALTDAMKRSEKAREIVQKAREKNKTEPLAFKIMKETFQQAKAEVERLSGKAEQLVAQHEKILLPVSLSKDKEGGVLPEEKKHEAADKARTAVNQAVNETESTIGETKKRILLIESKLNGTSDIKGKISEEERNQLKNELDEMREVLKANEGIERDAEESSDIQSDEASDIDTNSNDANHAKALEDEYNASKSSFQNAVHQIDELKKKLAVKQAEIAREMNKTDSDPGKIALLKAEAESIKIDLVKADKMSDQLQKEMTQKNQAAVFAEALALQEENKVVKKAIMAVQESKKALANAVALVDQLQKDLEHSNGKDEAILFELNKARKSREVLEKAVVAAEKAEAESHANYANLEAKTKGGNENERERERDLAIINQQKEREEYAAANVERMHESLNDLNNEIADLEAESLKFKSDRNVKSHSQEDHHVAENVLNALLARRNAETNALKTAEETENKAMEKLIELENGTAEDGEDAEDSEEMENAALAVSKAQENAKKQSENVEDIESRKVSLALHISKMKEEAANSTEPEIVTRLNSEIQKALGQEAKLKAQLLAAKEEMKKAQKKVSRALETSQAINDSIAHKKMEEKFAVADEASQQYEEAAQIASVAQVELVKARQKFDALNEQLSSGEIVPEKKKKLQKEIDTMKTELHELVEAEVTMKGVMKKALENALESNVDPSYLEAVKGLAYITAKAQVEEKELQDFEKKVEEAQFSVAEYEKELKEINDKIQSSTDEDDKSNMEHLRKEFQTLSSEKEEAKQTVQSFQIHLQKLQDTLNKTNSLRSSAITKKEKVDEKLSESRAMHKSVRLSENVQNIEAKQKKAASDIDKLKNTLKETTSNSEKALVETELREKERTLNDINVEAKKYRAAARKDFAVKAAKENLTIAEELLSKAKIEFQHVAESGTPEEKKKAEEKLNAAKKNIEDKAQAVKDVESSTAPEASIFSVDAKQFEKLKTAASILPEGVTKMSPKPISNHNDTSPALQLSFLLENASLVALPKMKTSLAKYFEMDREAVDISKSLLSRSGDISVTVVITCHGGRNQREKLKTKAQNLEAEQSKNGNSVMQVFKDIEDLEGAKLISIKSNDKVFGASPAELNERHGKAMNPSPMLECADKLFQKMTTRDGLDDVYHWCTNLFEEANLGRTFSDTMIEAVCRFVEGKFSELSNQEPTDEVATKVCGKLRESLSMEIDKLLAKQDKTNVKGKMDRGKEAKTLEKESKSSLEKRVKEKRLEDIIGEIDSDNDGNISVQEMMESFRKHHIHTYSDINLVTIVINEVDQNGDGKVNKQELKIHLENHRKLHDSRNTEIAEEKEEIAEEKEETAEEKEEIEEEKEDFTEDEQNTPLSPCCEEQFVQGCNDEKVEKCVCKFDSYCCDAEWDKLCVTLVDALKCSPACRKRRKKL
eukprot:g4945.t1